MSLPGTMTTLLLELRRRHVVRVAIVYAVVAWALVQVAATVGPALSLPDWTDSFVVLMALIGFPLAIVFAWAYDITPDGVRRTNGDDMAAMATPASAPTRPGTRPGPARRPRPPAAPTIAPRTAPPPPAPGPSDFRRAALATLRHELRTPLNAIIGYSELLLEDLPATRAEPLRAVREAGQRCLALINDILRPDGIPPTPDDEVLAAIRTRIRAEAGPTSERLSEISRDARQTLSGEPAAAAEDLDRIVEAADRLHAAVLGEVGGRLAEGRETAGEGEARNLAVRVVTAPPSTKAGGGPPPKHGHILVVDDNEDNRLLLSRQLAREGFSVAVAAEGTAALAAMQESDFDLVLLDMLMPALNGIDVLERMQDDPALAETPVIMMSAMDEIEGVARCLERGALDYLTKPFDPVLLQARIGATMELHRLRAQQRRTRQELEAEVTWSDRLVRSLVPGPLTERVRERLGSVVETHDAVLSMVVQLQGLGTYGMRQGAAALEEWIAKTMGDFEAIALDYPVELHWETGSTLLASTGTLPSRPLQTEAIAELALRLRESARQRAAGAEPVRIGIGVHSGPAVCALMDTHRISFGLWGEAPDTARELAWQCPTGEVRVSPAAHAALHETFEFEPRDILETTIGTRMRVFALVGRRPAPVST